MPCVQGTHVVVVVFDENHVRLDRQAVIKLHDRAHDRETWQTTSQHSDLSFCNLEVGAYDVEVSAVGYMSSRQDLQVTAASDGSPLEITLHKDPSAVDLTTSVDALPAHAQKDANRAVFDLKSGNLPDAQKRLDRIYKLAPSNAQVNFLFGYLYQQTNDLNKAASYLSRAAALNPHRVQTLALLGRVQMQRQDYDAARKTLEEAVHADDTFWMAHHLLADVYLREQEYEKARQQAQIAIDEGQAAASAAQLVLGEALISEGKTGDGIQVLKAFLESNPDNPAASRVRELIASSEKTDSNTASGQANAGDKDKNSDLALAASPPALTGSWSPPGVDDAKPTVAAGVACPTEAVLHESGERAKQLVEDIARFAAIENLLHQRLDPAGNATSTETRKFDYVASISEIRPGTLTTDEFRDMRDGLSDLPDHIATVGFMSLALIFHPYVRPNYEMTCEGLGEWRGQATWLVYFRQRKDKRGNFAQYKIGRQTYPMELKGRAWITADNFQIVHIESDLANQLPQLSLEHQIANYGPVHFEKKNVDLWLPQTVDIFIELNRHRYHRRHSFDHYMLFSTDATDSPVTQNDLKGKSTQSP